nr:hypothetical protein [Edaphovirga cremea]
MLKHLYLAVDIRLQHTGLLCRHFKLLVKLVDFLQRRTISSISPYASLLYLWRT